MARHAPKKLNILFRSGISNLIAAKPNIEVAKAKNSNAISLAR
jgi:hypothetical protein